MKIVAAHPGPHFSVHDVHVGWVEALQDLGNQVAEYNLGERLTFYDSAMVELPGKKLRKALSPKDATDLAVNGLYSTLYRLRPDVLFVTYAQFYPMELLDIARSYGTKVVLMHTESPYEDERQLEQAAHADINLINDPVSLEKFRAIAPTYYMPHSYRPTLHRSGSIDSSVAADLVFIGTGYPSRIRFFESMDLTGIDFFLGGNWQLMKKESPLWKYLAHEPDRCLDNEQTVTVYRSSRIGLNMYRRETAEVENECEVQGIALGPREVEMAATRMFFLREPREEGDELLWMLPQYESPEEVPSLTRWWLDHERERFEVAGKAREAVADRTFKNRAIQLMQLLEGK